MTLTLSPSRPPRWLLALFLSVILATAVAFGFALVGVASAQQGNTSDQNQTAPKAIDLGSATFQGCSLNGDVITADFDADRPTTITVYDAGVFSTEGTFNIPKKEVSLASGSSEIEMPVTVKNGRAALFIRSSTSATGCTVNRNRVFFHYVPSWLDVRINYIAALLGAVSTFAAVAYRFKKSFVEIQRIL